VQAAEHPTSSLAVQPSTVQQQIARLLHQKRLQKLAKALNSDEVRQFILTRYKGQIAPGF